MLSTTLVQMKEIKKTNLETYEESKQRNSNIKTSKVGKEVKWEIT